MLCKVAELDSVSIKLHLNQIFKAVRFLTHLHTRRWGTSRVTVIHRPPSWRLVGPLVLIVLLLLHRVRRQVLHGWRGLLVLRLHTVRFIRLVLAIECRLGSGFWVTNDAGPLS